ncbi:MAG: DUF3341 domain-containing protein [Vicinamibacterales bacterium]
MTDAPRPLYGLLAEFDDPRRLAEAAAAARRAGYRHVEAYTPFPDEAVSEAVGADASGVSRVVFLGGLAGACGGFLLQTWVSVWHYPLNVAGRPYFSWPSFIPVTFECTVLVAAVSGVIGMLAMNGLPRPYHPLFGVDGFERASQDRFFLCIERADPLFDLPHTHAFLERQGPLRVEEVAP